MKITLIAGARPNFMKVAPIIKAIKAAEAAGKDMHYRLVHTGQHYDKNMSDTFFEELAGFLLIIISDVKFLVDIIELALELLLVALCVRN